MSEGGSPGPAHLAPSGFFLLRTPLLPLEVMSRWSAELEAPRAHASGGELEAALRRDEARLRERLRALVADPLVQEALEVATDTLAESVDQLAEGASPERRTKVARAVLRYLSRMSTRPTPFGLFAGVSTGTFGERTVLALSGQGEYRTVSRLDMGVLHELAEALARGSAESSARRRWLYRPSSSLYELGGAVRWHETRRDPQRGRIYEAVSAPVSPALSAALFRAGRGATREELLLAVGESEPEAGAEEVEEFVRELLDSQVLVPDFGPALTGESYLGDLLQALGDSPEARALESALVHLREADAAGPGARSPHRTAAVEALRELPVSARSGRAVQVDLRKPGQLVLGRRLVRELERAMELLVRISGRPVFKELDQFRRAFRERYGEREVRLVEALDEDLGLGFGSEKGPGMQSSPLLRGLGLGAKTPAMQLGDRELLLFGLIERAQRARSLEVELTDEDLRHLEESGNGRSYRPAAAWLMAELISDSAEAVDRGAFELVEVHGGGPSGVEMIARFCHLDPHLLERVREHLRREEAAQPDAVYVEIVHHPDGRLGNVLFRPLLRSKELAFLGRSGAPEADQLSLSDLWVSLRGEELVLRSETLGREIVPRLSSAHAYVTRNVAAYRFLACLQAQWGMGFQWAWGALTRACGFLPRVRRGKLVLCRARWALRGAEKARLAEAEGAALFREAHRLREELRLPRWVLVARGDNFTAVDLENVLCLESLRQEAKRDDELLLIEADPGWERSPVQGPEGRFRNELVVPFLRAGTSPRPSRPRPSEARPEVERLFPPGSEWLYAKIYCGPAAADELLTETLLPAVTKLREEGRVDRWFFLRYSDPDFHLRLRLHHGEGRLHREGLDALREALAPAIADSVVSRWELATYERETERYGGPRAIALLEELFWVDSEAVARLLAEPELEASSEARWRAALLGCDRLLEDFGITGRRRLAVLAPAADGLGVELGAQVQRLAERFRAERQAVAEWLAASAASEGVAGFVARIFDERSARLRPVTAALRALSEEGALARPLEVIASSALHMHANRVFHANARAHELVVYDFLRRHHQSALARSSTR